MTTTLADHISLSSFDFSDLTPPQETVKYEPPRKLERIDRAPDERMADPLFAAMGQFRVRQYKEELEQLVVAALNSESDAYGGVIDPDESGRPLIWTGFLLLLSLGCFLPMAFFNGSPGDLFLNSHINKAVKSTSFRQALCLAIGCGLPKLVDLLSLLTIRSLRGASGCNIVLNLMNLCFTLPNIILFLLPGNSGGEALFICFLQWQVAMVSVFTFGYYSTNLAAQTDHLSIRLLAALVIFFSVCGAFVNTSVIGERLSRRFWIAWQVLRTIAFFWYLFHVKVFVSRLHAHKMAIGEGKLMHINFQVGILLHLIIFFTVMTHVWPLFFFYVYPGDYTTQVCTNIVLLRAAIVILINFAPFHLARMEKARARQLLRERIESASLSWLHA